MLLNLGRNALFMRFLFCVVVTHFSLSPHSNAFRPGVYTQNSNWIHFFKPSQSVCFPKFSFFCSVSPECFPNLWSDVWFSPPLHLPVEQVSNPSDVLHPHSWIYSLFPFSLPPPHTTLVLLPTQMGSHLWNGCLSRAPGWPSASDLFFSSTTFYTRRTLSLEEFGDVAGFL